MSDLTARIRAAGELTRRHFGRAITFYLPGMFIANGIRGEYPAISITGNRCDLACEHCGGKILSSMIATPSPRLLVETCQRLWRKGNKGVLISGGCDSRGSLPWKDFCTAIRRVKQTTDLIVSVHSGLIDRETALRLKDAGVDQALIDVIGDDDTFLRIYHLPDGVDRIAGSIEALSSAGLAVVPHIVCGLNYGRIKGELKAIDMLAGQDIELLVIVSLMPIPGAGTWRSPLPGAQEIAGIIAEARLRMPRTPLSLGCARRRGDRGLETLAIDAGVNRMALPSDTAFAHARDLGLDVSFQKTCCSMPRSIPATSWL